MNPPYPPRECPRFDVCSVNACPLHPQYLNLVVHPADKEKKCPMAKSIRVRIAAKYHGQLPMGGMTKAEYAAKLAFEAKPVHVRTALAERGKAALAKLHSSDELEKPR